MRRIQRQRCVQCILFVLVVAYGVTLMALQGQISTLATMRDEWFQAFRQGTAPAARIPQLSSRNRKTLSITTHYNRTYTVNFARPTSDYVIDEFDHWEEFDSRIPTWMKEYFRWHKQQRALLIKSNPSSLSSRFLVMSCFPNTRRCGGTADRLASLPYMIMMAAMFHRVLLIQWGRPAQLEEFLLPPIGGVDWRVPDSLKEFVMTDDVVSQTVKTSTIILAKSPLDQNLTVLRTVFQAHDKGSGFYNAHRPDADAELDFYQVFGPVWSVFFTPSPPVGQLIRETMQRNNLVPGDYVAVHLRALYNVKTRKDSLVMAWARNAIDCASTLATSPRMYFASDSLKASQAAVEYGRKKGLNVVTGHENQEPFHLDTRDGWHDRPPSDYFGSFRDLYLMSMSHCVAHGIGSFGIFAAMMSNNVSCAVQHHYQSGMANCTFRQPPLASPNDMTFPGQLFPEPMSDVDHSTARQPASNAPPLVGNDLYPFPLNPLKADSIWKRSIVLPQWAINYFEWHRQQRLLLREENWTDFRFIVMGCLSSDSKCGGTADRLQSLPFVLRAAAESKRILFIHWDVPALLDAFLLPPQGGIDWRLPSWLYDKAAQIPQSEVIRTVTVFVDRLKNESQVLTRIRIQSHTHGSDVYNERAKVMGESPRAWREHFHDIWYTFFTPAPALARAIEDQMEQLRLVPGNFAYAHIRALYNHDESDPGNHFVRNWTANAINCLSELKGGPYFVSSDSSYAKGVAIEYGRQRNTRVVARVDAKEPLHIDHVQNLAAASDLYSVFVDLYIMSLGECMVYNLGNFGKMANLISGRNFTCNTRFWTNGVNKASAKKDGCTWVDRADVSERIAKLQRPLFLPPMS